MEQAPPVAARMLSGTHTMGFISFERLDAMVRAFDAGFQTLTPERQRAGPQQLVDPAARIEFLGFDPTTREGWLKGAGIDPKLGVGAFFDARIQGPVFYAKINDPDALARTLTRLGFTLRVAASKDGVRRLILNGDRWVVAQKGSVSFAFSARETEDQLAAFARFRAADQPLAFSPRFKRAFADASGGQWVTGYVDSAAVVAPLGDMAGTPGFLAKRFESIGLAIGEARMGLRVRADATARAAFEQMFAVGAPTPDFARRLGKVTAVGRIDLKIGSLVEGMLALLPPGADGLRDTLQHFDAQLPSLIGVDRASLDAALSGHFAIATTPAGQGTPLVLAGVRDAGKLDAVLASLNTRFAGKSITVSGQAALQFESLWGLTAVRADGLLFVGAQTDVEAALTRTQSGFSDAVAARINEVGPLGAFVPLGASSTGPSVSFSSNTAAQIWSENVVDDVVISAVRFDDRGLYLGDFVTASAVGGMLAAVAVPAYLKFQRRRRAEEGREALRYLAFRAMQVGQETGAFPASIPRTPATPACRDGKSFRSRAPDHPGWQHPSWKQLEFWSDFSLFQHELISDGQSFTARVYGDLDCDGVFSTFEQSGRIGAKAPGPMRVRDLLE
jgi:hypothetical protein